MLGMFGETFAEFLGEEFFFTPGFSIEREQDNRKTQKRPYLSLEKNGSNDRDEQSAINRMADPFVWSTANQVVSRLDGDCAAPVCPERYTRPHSKHESAGGEQQTGDADAVVLRNDMIGEKTPREAMVIDEHESNHHWNDMLEALPGKLAAFGWLAPRRHKKPDDAPREPDFRGELKCLCGGGH